MRPGEALLNISDFLLAGGHDDDVAVIDGRSRYTYAELRVHAARIVAELERSGVEPGSAIGVLAANSFFWVAAYLAAMKLGVVVPLSERNTVGDLAAQAEWVDLAAVLIDRRAERRLGAAFGDRLRVTDAILAGTAEANWPDRVTDPASDAALMFTSGTTSRPKAVRVTHANLRANTESIVSYLELGRGDRMLVILPFHYCFGASLLHTHLAVGGSVVLCNTFTFPETAVDLIETESCTGLAGVPSSFQLLLRASSYATRILPSLRLVQQAGGRLAPPQIEQLAAAQPGSRLFVMYGQTEATARLSYLPPDMLSTKLGSIGRGIPGVRLRVLDEAGLPVPSGVEGEIVASGANISPGYHRDPEATARKFPGGDLRTGDLATVDSDGYIFIVGRSGEFIKSWGHRVSPQQIEESALTHPAVAEAAVVGLPDEAAGEAIALAVVPVEGVTPDSAELIKHLANLLPKHMLPSSVHILAAFPLNASGKVARPELRRLLEVARAR
ncbi:MAG: AMP-binding protein [Propionibacteriaceae bacterium]|nr:AMP-binding protein [Propionibacteriaceae bacterium]